MTPIRVLLVDDDASIRSSLRMLIDNESGMTIAGEAADGAEAIDLASSYRPDVVLMDVQMPRMNGLEATRALSADPAGPRVIMLTMFDLDEYVFEAMSVGASGFLLKNSPPSEVLRAIRVVHAGDALLAPEVTRRLIDAFAARANVRSGPDTRLDHLTAREHETLLLIARGLSNAEIAAALFLTPTTVRTYVSRILSKLAARDRSQLVVIAYSAGLVGSTGHH